MDYDENLFGDGGIRLQLTGDVAFIAVVGVAVIADLGDDDCYGVLRIFVSNEFEDWGKKQGHTTLLLSWFRVFDRMLSRARLNCSCAPIKASVRVCASRVSSATWASRSGLASIWRTLIVVSWITVSILMLLPKLFHLLRLFPFRGWREWRGT